MPCTKPAEVLKVLMQEHGLKQSDMREISSRDVVSEVLAGRHNLNTRQTRAAIFRFIRCISLTHRKQSAAHRAIPHGAIRCTIAPCVATWAQTMCYTRCCHALGSQRAWNTANTMIRLGSARKNTEYGKRRARTQRISRCITGKRSGFSAS